MKLLSRKTLQGAMFWILVVFMLTVLAGCATVGPDYTPPQTIAAPSWRTSLEGGLAVWASHQALAAWWATMNDPDLSGLIEQAVAGNLDLKKARVRVREARARRGMSESSLFPTLDATGSVNRSHGSRGMGAATTSDLYTAGLDASWEIDLFGGVRRSVEAAEADIEATGEDLRDVLVSLLAEVALNYIDIRTGQARLAEAETSLATQEETYRLVMWRAQAGLGDELAVRQARYNLESTRAQIPVLCTAIGEAKNRLAVLLGEQAGTLHAAWEARRPIPIPPPEIVIGTPADLLRQRPDVRRAERQLAAQTARVGVATAELYPKLKLSGTIGLEALSFNRLFSSGSGTSSGGSGVTWRIFDAGAVRRNIEVQSALQEQSLIAYEAAVLGALEEAENAILSYADEHRRRESLNEAVRSAKQAAELAEIKYRAGMTDFGSVLEAQRSLLTFRDQLAQSEGAIVTNLVKIYKAMGGGWTSLAPEGKKLSGDGEKS